MSADTYSSSLGALLQGTGNNSNAWGTDLNAALQLLDTGINGVYSNAGLVGGNLAMDGVVPPAGPHPLPQMIVVLGGTLAANQTVTVPNVPKLWLVANDCTGAFKLQFKTTSGTAGSAIPQGGVALVYCDGANNIFVGLSTALRDVQWLGADGTLALPGISFASEATLGLRRVSVGVMALTVGGVDIATISATGVDVAAGLAVTVGGVAPVPPGTEVATAAIRAPTGWYLEYGQAVTRSGDAGLFAALTQTFTATTNGTTTLSAVSVDLTNLGLEGSVLEGTGIFTGATIVSITSTTIVMSNAATNSVAGGAVRAFPYGNGDGSTTFNLPDARGTVAAGRTNMGGTALTNLTTAGSGVNALRLNTVSGNQNITLSLGQIPAGITSGNASQAISVLSTVGGIPSTMDNGQFLAYNGASSGYYSPGKNGAGGTVPLGQISSTGNNSIGVTSNNTGGSTTPLVQPSRIRNVLIKR